MVIHAEVHVFGRAKPLQLFHRLERLPAMIGIRSRTGDRTHGRLTRALRKTIA
jgi:hypothetical protein